MVRSLRPVPAAAIALVLLVPARVPAGASTGLADPIGTGYVTLAEVSDVAEDFSAVSHDLDRISDNMGYLIKRDEKWVNTEELDPGTGRPIGDVLLEQLQAANADVKRFGAEAGEVAGELSDATTQLRKGKDATGRRTFLSAFTRFGQLSSDILSSDGLRATLALASRVMSDTGYRPGMTRVGQIQGLAAFLPNRLDGVNAAALASGAPRPDDPSFAAVDVTYGELKALDDQFSSVPDDIQTMTDILGSLVRKDERWATGPTLDPSSGRPLGTVLLEEFAAARAAGDALGDESDEVGKGFSGIAKAFKKSGGTWASAMSRVLGRYRALTTRGDLEWSRLDRALTTAQPLMADSGYKAGIGQIGALRRIVERLQSTTDRLDAGIQAKITPAQ